MKHCKPLAMLLVAVNAMLRQWFAVLIDAGTPKLLQLW
jgi:hypothetical protein